MLKDYFRKMIGEAIQNQKPQLGGFVTRIRSSTPDITEKDIELALGSIYHVTNYEFNDPCSLIDWFDVGKFLVKHREEIIAKGGYFLPAPGGIHDEVNLTWVELTDDVRSALLKSPPAGLKQ